MRLGLPALLSEVLSSCGTEGVLLEVYRLANIMLYDGESNVQAAFYGWCTQAGGQARPAPIASSYFPLFPSTFSSLPLVFGCSDVAC